MKLTVSPLAKHIAIAEDLINRWFVSTPLDVVHDRKRQTAAVIIAGGAVPAEFEAAAQIEGMSPFELAEVIVSKPDDLMARENERRKAILDLRAVTDASQIRPLLDAYGITLRATAAVGVDVVSNPAAVVSPTKSIINI